MVECSFETENRGEKKPPAAGAWPRRTSVSGTRMLAAFRHFDDLHPEYEVIDWRGHPYFVDFVRIRGQLRFAFEIKGYGPHVQHADRTLCGAFMHHSPRSRPGGRRKRAGPAVTGRCLRGPGYGRSRGAHSSIRVSIASASRDRSCGAGIGGRPSRSQRFCAISRLPSGFRWSQSRISFA